MKTTKTKLTIIAAIAAMAMAWTQTSQAVPVVGTIGFSGTAVLDGANANTSTKVVSWNNNAIGLHTGTFASLTGAASVAFAAPWFFNSAALPNFWTVTDSGNTYTFNLTSSSVSSTSATSATIALAGTVVSSVFGLDPTAFTGNMTIHDPSIPGQTGFSYTESLSFSSVPDGGSAALLLGSALTGLGLIRRKLSTLA